MDKTLSIVLPSYNEEQMIEKPQKQSVILWKGKEFLMS